MDDQNNNPGGSTPSEPAAPVAEPSTPEPTVPPTEEPPMQTQPQSEQKCVTCGNAAAGGNCVTCGLGETACTCPPAQGSGPGPSAPGGEMGQGGPAPAV